MFHAILDAIASRFLFWALHLTNTSSFPPPLSAEEETELLHRAAANDRAARDKLIEHNLRLVVHVIKKYYATCTDQDDLISVGTIGLIKAINTFNIEKGARLATYAARCIDNEILMCFRNQKKTAQDVSMSEPIDIDNEGNPLTLMDVIFMDDTIADEIDLKIKVEKLYDYVEKMPIAREKEILIMRYGLYGNEYHTQRQVAKKLNISRSYVSRIEKKVIQGLQKAFAASK
ncbi:MAG: RNA polymerase sporulation sigma factor SigK [Oscillospiraceae bacterium]|jgi:RNA polymerase sporulation-specific sigma factor|nr:RNA polymerase sporulation sigma factor SigK [Oscillospiraceae bacterium]